MNTIAAVSTRTGLTVTAELDTGDYPKGIKVSDREMKDLEKSTTDTGKIYKESGIKR